MFGIFERRLTATREFDALFELFHGLLERQVAGFEFLDQVFEVGDGLFEVGDFLGAHRVLSAVDAVDTLPFASVSVNEFRGLYKPVQCVDSCAVRD